MSQEHANSSKEIYALYGYCLFMSQCIERFLQLILTTIARRDGREISDKEYDDLLALKYSETLGNLVNDLEGRGEIKKLEPELRKALRRRNQLVHEYFFRYNFDINKPENTRKIITELTRDVRFFEKTILQVTDFVFKWGETVGIDLFALESDLKFADLIISDEIKN